MNNDFTHNLFYMFAFWWSPRIRNLIYFSPMALYFMLGLAYFISMRMKFLYNITFIKPKIDYIITNELYIKKLRCKIEVLILVLITWFTIIGRGSLFLLIFYGNFLRIKYMINDTFKKAMREIDVKLGRIS